MYIHSISNVISCLPMTGNHDGTSSKRRVQFARYWISKQANDVLFYGIHLSTICFQSK